MLIYGEGDQNGRNELKVVGKDIVTRFQWNFFSFAIGLG